jgi:ribosome biogenesis GTPase / thiamine phosphate phosphatase
VLSGKFRYLAEKSAAGYPVVGDWVSLTLSASFAMIHSVLTRRNVFSRQFSGSSIGEQVVAANLDHVFIVMGLDQDFNLKRLDRYLVMAQRGGVHPVVVLSKADLCAEVSLHVARTCYERAPDLAVLAVSTYAESGLAELSRLVAKGSSILLVGSSGAGKSTLVNYLVGRNVARTETVSLGNGRGRCTTSMTSGYWTSSGALLIDGPGMREIQLWAECEDLNGAFDDVSQLAAQCKFRDCQHQGEPGCMLRQALLEGRLTHERFLNYMKLTSEVSQSHEDMLESKRKRFKAIARTNRKRRRMWYGS